MNKDQIKLLNKMKQLIKLDKKKFKIRKDRDYITDLKKIGITIEEAWKQILTLNTNFYYIDNKPYYNKNKNTLTFKKIINKKLVYIKLELEEYKNELVVCWSFHIDERK